MKRRKRLRSTYSGVGRQAISSGTTMASSFWGWLAERPSRLALARTAQDLGVEGERFGMAVDLPYDGPAEAEQPTLAPPPLEQVAHPLAGEQAGERRQQCAERDAASGVGRQRRDQARYGDR